MAHISEWFRHFLASGTVLVSPPPSDFPETVDPSRITVSSSGRLDVSIEDVIHTRKFQRALDSVRRIAERSQ